MSWGVDSYVASMKVSTRSCSCCCCFSSSPSELASREAPSAWMAILVDVSKSSRGPRKKEMKRICASRVTTNHSLAMHESISLYSA